MSKQCTKLKRKRDDSWFKDKVLLVQAQANGQILHEEELAFLVDLRIAEGALMANLSHYGSNALVKVYNHDNVNNNMINQAVQAMPSSEQSNINSMNSPEPTLSSRPTKVEVPKELPKVSMKAQQLGPKLYDGNVIKNTCAIVIPDSKETLMLVKESRSKMLSKQHDPMILEKKVNTTPINYVVLNQLSQDFDKRFVPQTKLSAEQAFWSQNSMNSSDPTPSSRPTKVKVPKELPKVSMEKVLVITALKDALRKLKGKDIADDAITSHSIAPEMLNVDVEPLNPRLLNNTSAHSDYLKHTQKEAVILREIVKQGKSKNPLNAYLDYA
nr:hypothetical protein [Tanacetum cinerariifolium]